MNHSAISRWSPIIGGIFLSLLVAGCSATRVAYNQAPTLIYFWLDDYVDFNRDQEAQAQDLLKRLHQWHRTQEMPRIAALLRETQTLTANSAVTGEQVCKLYSAVQDRLRAPLDEVLTPAAALAASLEEDQLQRMAREYAKRNKKWQNEWANDNPAEQLEKRSKQIYERAETFYGRLSSEQRKMIQQALTDAAYEPQRALREFQRRQQDTLQTLQTIRTNQLTPEAGAKALAGLAQRSLHSPDASYRQYSDRMVQGMCSALAQLHNSTTPEQRAHLAKELRGYEQDATQLAQLRD